MALKWTEELAVGVEAIDNQHKSIFAHANPIVPDRLVSKPYKQVR